jgi:hypothetical protein
LRRSPSPLTRIRVLVTSTVSACQSTSYQTTASASPMRTPVASMKNTKSGRSRRLALASVRSCATSSIRSAVERARGAFPRLSLDPLDLTDRVRRDRAVADRESHHSRASAWPASPTSLGLSPSSMSTFFMAHAGGGHGFHPPACSPEGTLVAGMPAAGDHRGIAGQHKFEVVTRLGRPASTGAGSRTLLRLKGPCDEVSDHQTQNASQDIAYLQG